MNVTIVLSLGDDLQSVHCQYGITWLSPGTLSQIRKPTAMDPTHLHQLAVEAMRSRGLLPVFPPKALKEANAAHQTGLEPSEDIRDLRHLAW